MKKTFLFLLGISFALMASAEIRVLSDVKLGEGFYPRFIDAETVSYLTTENAEYVAAPVTDETALRVDNENLDLNLYRNGEKIVLKPHGDENYICASLSPDQTRILFRTKKGTAICDLNGNELVNLGREINAPVWYGNDYVVGMDSEHDGYYNTSAAIVIASVETKELQYLTNPTDMGIFPNVDAASGRIVYCTESGDIRLLQLNLTEQPIRKSVPRLVQKPDGTLLKKLQEKKGAMSPSSVKIYINPGHGGYESDDRLMYLYPIFVNQVVQEPYTREQSFWESVSNLDKGMRLDTMLRELGFQTKMSRITNTGDDDKDLYDIVVEANTYGANFMLSIHSNAGNPSNYILQLYSGRTEGDNSSYSDMPVNEVTSRRIATLMGDNQYLNEVSCWTRVPMIAGDKTFAKNIMGWSNGYGVLRWLKVPGTLSEGMMHDYLPETYRLMNIDYKRQESFYFAKTFYTWFCEKDLPYGAIGGRIHDVYQKQLFPDYKPNKNTRDVYRPILKGVVELWQDGNKLASYTTDTLYNGCYFFWNLQPGTYVVKATPDGYYAQEETLVVENGKISYANFGLSMKRETPPVVLDYSPKVELEDSVLVSTNLTISFNWDMDEEATAAALSITPAVEGTITFEDDAHTLRFKPASRFEPGTEYTVTLSTDACHPDATYNNHLQEPFTFKFRTQNRGSVRVIQTYPENGAEGVPVDAAFIAIFDGKLANSSNKYFKVYDSAGNDISPASRNVKLNGAAPAPYGSAKFELKAGTLKANSEYKMIIGAEVADVNGVIVNDPVTITFKTGDEVTSTLPIFNNLDTLYFEGDKETSVGVASVSTLRNTASKYEGLASNKLTYTFSETNGEAVYTVDDVTAIKGNDKATLGMHVFGDYTFNTLYAKWAVEGDIQYTKICDLNYAGWLYQEADMSALPAGVDYQFMGFKIVRGASFLSEKGETSVDAIRVVFEPSVDSAVDQIEGPDSEKSKVMENGYLHILKNGVKYNVHGATVE
ncbi:MAG: Ig-like domain-containing protein [Paludibacteraceae bacterium]|nr:Ig-like domain-containing protein [Paludibacteraceae bacterium]